MATISFSPKTRTLPVQDKATLYVDNVSTTSL